MSEPAVTAFIGLGSNLENPREQVSRALKELAAIPQTTLEKRSSLYRSEPIGPAGQPDYINAVARISTQLQPLQLLDALQAIEDAHGRKRELRWGARTLDLDLLLYGEQTIQHPRLTVPHPEMHRRAFVLAPLAAIDPDLKIPGRGSISDLLLVCEGPVVEPVQEPGVCPAPGSG